MIKPVYEYAIDKNCRIGRKIAYIPDDVKTMIVYYKPRHNKVIDMKHNIKAYLYMSEINDNLAKNLLFSDRYVKTLYKKHLKKKAKYNKNDYQRHFKKSSKYLVRYLKTFDVSDHLISILIRSVLRPCGIKTLYDSGSKEIPHEYFIQRRGVGANTYALYQLAYEQINRLGNCKFEKQVFKC